MSRYAWTPDEHPGAYHAHDDKNPALHTGSPARLPADQLDSRLWRVEVSPDDSRTSNDILYTLGYDYRNFHGITSVWHVRIKLNIRR